MEKLYETKYTQINELETLMRLYNALGELEMAKAGALPLSHIKAIENHYKKSDYFFNKFFRVNKALLNRLNYYSDTYLIL